VNRRRLIQRTLATPTLAVLVACGPSQTADPKPAETTSASGASGTTTAPSAPTTQSQANKPVDQSKRAEAYKQFQRIVWDEQPYLVYFNPPQIASYRKNVQSYPNNYNGYWGLRDFDKVWKAAR